MAKSIIQIDVDDANFKKFQAVFQKYQDAVNALPDAWAKVNVASGKGKNDFAQTVATTQKLNANLQSISKATQNTATHANAGAMAFRKIGAETSSIARNVLSITGNLLKWVSIGGLLGGGGGLFGLSRLAESASRTRRETFGMGSNAGQLAAAKSTYGQYFDIEGLISTVNEARSSYEGSARLNNLGISNEDIAKKSSAEIAIQLIPEIARVFKEAGGKREGVEPRLGNVATFETARSIGAVPAGELAQQEKIFRNRERELQVSDQSLKNAADFNAALDASGTKIKHAFIDGLSPLMPELTKLTDAFSGAVKQFLRSPQVGEFIANLSGHVKQFADYLGTPEFHGKLIRLIDGLSDFGGAVMKVVNMISPSATIESLQERRKKLDAREASLSKAEADTQKRGESAWTYKYNMESHKRDREQLNKEYAELEADAKKYTRQHPVWGIGGKPSATSTSKVSTSGVVSPNDIFTAYVNAGIRPDIARIMTAGAGAESSLNPNISNMEGGGRGAHGLNQHRGSRLDDFARLKGKPLAGSPWQEQVQFSAHELLKGNYQSVYSRMLEAKSDQEKMDIALSRYWIPINKNKDPERYYPELNRRMGILQSQGVNSGLYNSNVTRVQFVSPPGTDITTNTAGAR